MKGVCFVTNSNASLVRHKKNHKKSHSSERLSLIKKKTSNAAFRFVTTPVPQTNIFGSTLYYESQTVNGCESLRAEITVYVTGLPTIQLPQDGSVCFNFVTNTLISAYTLSIGSFGNYTVEWFVDNGGLFTVIPFATENNY